VIYDWALTTDAVVYETVPSPQLMKRLIKENYTVFVNEDNDISDEIRNIQGIRLVHFAAP